MVFHPPALFAAYVALAVPFAFATAALVLGEAGREWVRAAQRWTVAGWALPRWGSAWAPGGPTSCWLGRLLGLGPGREHLAHSLAHGDRPAALDEPLPAARPVQALDPRPRLRHVLAGLAGHLDHAHGQIASVHAFEHNDTLIAILTALLVVVAVSSVSLLAWRWRSLGAVPPGASRGVRPGAPQGPPLGSRDVLHSLINVALCACAAALLLATVAVPLLFDRTVTPATYRLFAQPLGVVVVAALALCPLLGGARASGATVWRALRVPLLVTVLALPLLLATGDWRSNLFGLIGLEVCVLAGAALIWSVLVGAQRAAGEQGLLTGLRRTLIGSRTRSAAYVAHCGVILVLVGLLGSNVYKIERNAYVAARPGATAQVAGYTLRFTGFTLDMGPQSSQRFFAHFVVARGGRQVGLIAPHTDVYPQAGAALRAVILGSLGRDLFVVAQDPFDATSTHLRLQLDVFPLIDLVWVGTLLMVAGGAVSLWPRRVPETVAALESADEAHATRAKARATPDDALGDEVL